LGHPGCDVIRSCINGASGVLETVHLVTDCFQAADGIRQIDIKPCHPAVKYVYDSGGFHRRSGNVSGCFQASSQRGDVCPK
jgi:hypothetical protein